MRRLLHHWGAQDVVTSQRVQYLPQRVSRIHAHRVFVLLLFVVLLLWVCAAVVEVLRHRPRGQELARTLDGSRHLGSGVGVCGGGGGGLHRRRGRSGRRV